MWIWMLQLMPANLKPHAQYVTSAHLFASDAPPAIYELRQAVHSLHLQLQLDLIQNTQE